MKYKDALNESMENLARDDKVIFIGYNVTRASRANGTLKNIPLSQCLETPCAENLMADLAIGLALDGFKPVVYFERHDFTLNALDALVNHLDKMEELPNSEFMAPVIVRAVVGGTKPFYPGRQHIQDFTNVYKDLFHFPVYDLKTPKEIIEKYNEAGRFKKSTMLIERRDLYELEN